MLGLSKRKILINIKRTTLVLVLLFSFSIVSATHVSAQPVTTDPATPITDNSDAGTEETDEEISCAIEKVGWILCPIIDAAGRVSDRAFQFLATNFLETEAELVSNSDGGTKHAWELARNMANIMFIIAFLIIIYSQVTGAGISNYGIKKMLPRLIITAVAVNVSYYICQGMVDLTNVIGYEIQNFLVSTAKGISDYAAMPPAGSLVGFGGESSPGTLEQIISIALGTATLIWFLLPFIFLGAGTIAITCLIILFILLLRKAFIVLLIVLAPIAFVLYLLPNTEKLFQKWLSMFWKLLMVFPVVGLLMGGGQLASAIILSAGSTSDMYKSGDKCIQLPTYEGGATLVENSNSDQGGLGSGIGNAQAEVVDGDKVKAGDCTRGGTSLLLGLVAAMVAVAPLIAVFSVLKAALAGAGAIGGKIAGAVDTYTRKGGEWGSKNTAIGRGMAARKAIKQNYKDQNFAKRMSKSGKNRSAYDRYTQLAARGITGNIGQLANKANIEKLNGVGGSLRVQDSKLAANFAGAADKIEAQEMSERQTALNRETGGDMDQIQDRLQTAVENGDKAGAMAAQNLLFGMGGAGVDAFVKGMDKAGTKASSDILKELQQNIRLHHGNIKSTSAGVSHWATGQGQGGQLLGNSMSDASAYSNLSAEQFASQSGETLKSMKTAMDHAMTTHGDASKPQVERDAALALAQGIVNGAQAAKTSKAFEGVKVGNKSVIEDISVGKYK